MKLFEKVLVPLDGSEHSLRALKSAIQIAKKFKSEVTLIYVYSRIVPITSPIPMFTSATLPTEAALELVEVNRRVGTDILEEGQKRASVEAIKVEKLLEEGHVTDEVLKAAERGQFDLIVIGARGLGRMKEILLGSVSHGVVRHSKCPVLIVK